MNEGRRETTNPRLAAPTRRATGWPRSVMMTSSPAWTRSTQRLRSRRSSAPPTSDTTDLLFMSSLLECTRWSAVDEWDRQ